MSDYYTRDGSPLTFEQAMSNPATDRRVAHDVAAGFVVSTVFLSLNHRYGDGRPLIFETMTFPATDDGEVADWGETDCWRWSTETEAAEGHKAVVAWLLNEGPRP